MLTAMQKRVNKMGWFDILKADSVGKLTKGLKKLLKKGYHKRLTLVDWEQGSRNLKLKIRSNITDNEITLSASATPKDSGAWLNTQKKFMTENFMKQKGEDITPYMDKNWKAEE